MESEIKDILIQKLKEKNVRKFNGYTLGLHANHIANALLKKKGIKKGSADYESEHTKLKQMIKDIHKDLEPQTVSKKTESPSAPPAPSITPAQLAKETSTEAPVPKESVELKKAKEELKALKAILHSSKDVTTELATKIQNAYKRYKEIKKSKEILKNVKASKMESKLSNIKERLELATAVKRVTKALKKNVELKKSESETDEYSVEKNEYGVTEYVKTFDEDNLEGKYITDYQGRVWEFNPESDNKRGKFIGWYWKGGYFTSPYTHTQRYYKSVFRKVGKPTDDPAKRAVPPLAEQIK